MYEKKKIIIEEKGRKEYRNKESNSEHLKDTYDAKLNRVKLNRSENGKIKLTSQQMFGFIYLYVLPLL